MARAEVAVHEETRRLLKTALDLLHRLIVAWHVFLKARPDLPSRQLHLHIVRSLRGLYALAGQQLRSDELGLGKEGDDSSG